MDFWKLLQSYTWTNAGWILLYVISIIFIYQLVKEKKQSDKVIIFIIISALIFFNPFFASITFQRVFPSYKEYSRVSWLFFAPVVVSIAVVELASIKKCKRKVSVWLAYALILLIISLTSLIPESIKYLRSLESMMSKSLLIFFNIVLNSS